MTRSIISNSMITNRRSRFWEIPLRISNHTQGKTVSSIVYRLSENKEGMTLLVSKYRFPTNEIASDFALLVALSQILLTAQKRDHFYYSAT